MAGRQRSTFQKRQKEVKRLETQRMKAEKRAARNQVRALNRAAGISSENFPLDTDIETETEEVTSQN